MMTINQFIQTYKLRPADAIVLKTLPFGLLDHYIIYLGLHRGEHKFIANYINGIRLLRQQDFSDSFMTDKIRRFIGNEVQRSAAVNRALVRVDENSYNLLLNSFSQGSTNLIQHVKPINSKAAITGTTMAIAGLITASSAKDSGIKSVGLFAAALGLLTLLLDENDLKRKDE